MSTPLTALRPPRLEISSVISQLWEPNARIATFRKVNTGECNSILMVTMSMQNSHLRESEKNYFFCKKVAANP